MSPPSHGTSPNEVSGLTQRKTFFFHVLKTGGVTFRKILGSIYGDAFHVCYDPTVASIEAALQTAQAMEFHTFHFRGQLANMHSDLLRQNRLDLVEGHNNFTMLRDPVDQSLSLYYYVLRRRVFLEPVYIARGLRFPETMEDYLDGPHQFNQQTAFFADRFQTPGGELIGRDDLRLALDLIARLDMRVGLMERFADSMNVFENVTGKNIPGDMIYSHNRNPARPPLEAVPHQIRDRIREQSALDMELYAFGRERFLEDIARCPPARKYVFLETTETETEVLAAAPVGLSAKLPGPVGSPRTAVFLHIMKTGGMTFRKILASIYGDAFHVVEDPAIESIQADLKKYACVEFHTLPFQGDYAHMHRGLAELQRWDVLQGTDIFTMLREPVDQVVSQYFYMVRQRALIEPAYKANGMPFPETIDQYLDNPVHLNNQLAFLAGKYRLKPGNDVTQDDLIRTQQMMLSLDVHAGLTERFAESLHVFETVTGRRVPGGQILNQNQNADRLPLEAISIEVKQRIRRLSALDMELYGFAQTVFMKDVAQCGPTRQYSFIDTAAKPGSDSAR